MIGETAAMALPPQIAVPADNRYDKGLSSLKTFPRMNPKSITLTILTTVNINPVFPACRASSSFSPKPNPTIEICNSRWIYWCKCFSKEFPIKTARPKPRTRAIGDDIKRVRHKIASMIKTAFRTTSFWMRSFILRTLMMGQNSAIYYHKVNCILLYWITISYNKR